MHTGMILVDLLKAFDTLDSVVLLEKMNYFGFWAFVIKWFDSVAANQAPDSLMPFFTLINTLLVGYNAIFNPTTKTHFFTLFNRKKPPKSRYTRKQPAHFL